MRHHLHRSARAGAHARADGGSFAAARNRSNNPAEPPRRFQLVVAVCFPRELPWAVVVTGRDSCKWRR